jgi:CubicO group peptidase (beta-lactamase class C family)
MKFLYLLIFVCPLLLSCKHKTENKSQDPVTTYSDIESGLLPAVIIGDSILQNYTISEAMETYNVPGVSLALFKDGDIVWTSQYGTIAKDSAQPITSATKFQAASISKAITALGVLKLVETYNLDLDTDINTYLKSWKAESEFAESKKVTIRQLLNHTSGATVQGFHGYSKGGPTPSLLDIVNGKGNSAKVEISTVPGTQFSYSGGGFAILQLLVQDVTGNDFESYFQDVVFSPLKMTHSTFNQFPKDNIALGHDDSGKMHPEGHLIFPELSAAGLWTTPTDLAKFSIAIANSYKGKPNSFISQDLATQMLTVTKVWGLGVGVRGEGDTAFFFHAGGNPGSYKSILINHYNQNTGIAVMTNAKQGNTLNDDILRSFSALFENSVFEPSYITPYELSEKETDALVGKYQLEEEDNYFLDVYSTDSNRIVLHDLNDGMKVTFVPVSKTEFIDVDNGGKSSFTIDSITKKVVKMNYGEGYVFKKVDK